LLGGPETDDADAAGFPGDEALFVLGNEAVEAAPTVTCGRIFVIVLFETPAWRDHPPKSMDARR